MGKFLVLFTSAFLTGTNKKGSLEKTMEKMKLKKVFPQEYPPAYSSFVLGDNFWEISENRRRLLGNGGYVRRPRRGAKRGGNKSEYYKVYRFCRRRESRRRERMMHEIIQYKIMSHTYSCSNYMRIDWGGRRRDGAAAASALLLTGPHVRDQIKCR